MKIYYFCSSLMPLHDYWILKEILDKGLDVITIDIYELNQGHLRACDISGEEFEYSICIDSKRKLYSVIKGIEKDSIAFVGTSGGLFEDIRGKLAIKGVNVICDTTFGLPALNEMVSKPKADIKKNRYSFFYKIKKYLSYNGMFKGSLKIAYRLIKKINALSSSKINSNIYLITSGSKSHCLFKHVKNADNHIKLYHSSAMQAGSQNIINRKYAVFIDQAIPYHRDSIKNGHHYKDLSDDYFDSMNRFLSDYQTRTGLEVIIAMHPRSDKSKSYFSNFRCLIGKTAELIEHSDVVITHYSTCIYHSVWFNKPIVFVTNEMLEKHHHRQYIYMFAQLLGCDVHNIDKIKKELFYIPSIDGIKYKKFIENYICQSDSVYPNDIVWALSRKFKL